MGFLSDVFGGIGKVVKSFVGLDGGAAAAPAPQQRALAIPGPVRTAPQQAAAAVQGGALGTLQSILQNPFVTGPLSGIFRATGALASVAAPAIAGAIAGPVGGNGRTMKITQVLTIRIADNAVINMEVLKGAPFLMNSDIRKLRGISRKVSKAASRIPKRVSKQSPMAALTEATVTQALQAVRTAGTRALCPPG